MEEGGTGAPEFKCFSVVLVTSSHGAGMLYVSNIIRESGSRLGLVGHWWNLSKKDENIEAMTRHYCNSIEVSILCLLKNGLRHGYLKGDGQLTMYVGHADKD